MTSKDYIQPPKMKN